jgi:hypothetical protein
MRFQQYKSLLSFYQSSTQLKTVLRSRSRKELHHLGGAGAKTRCGSSFDNGIKHGQELKTKFNSL